MPIDAPSTSSYSVNSKSGNSPGSATSHRTPDSTEQERIFSQGPALEDVPQDGEITNPADDASSNPSWKGWAELENDPLIFSTLLLEWGVPDVQVNEVVPLDSIFDTPSEATFGVIFLSRWAEIEAEKLMTGVPPDLWFANQTSSFSCATVAIMNIINNCPEVDLGERLNNFRKATMALSPKDRGLALDQFEHVRNAHNSFASELDKMSVDLRLKEDAAAAARKKAASSASPRKRGRKRRKTVEEDSDDDEAGFHFVAYVPSHGQVWRMDGMEPMPLKLGTSSTGDNWLATVLPDLQAQLESATTNQLEFSLLSLTRPTEHATSVASDQAKMVRAREQWGPFIAYLVQLHAEKGDLKDMLS